MQPAKDRVITAFPQAFDSRATPYKSIDYAPVVKTACQRDRTTIGVRLCKAIVVGEVAVGKTSLVNRFCHEVFDNDYKATIGVDFEVEKFSIQSYPFTLQIWDTAGQERFRSIAASYYRGANVIIVSFDLTDAVRTLMAAKSWHAEAMEGADNPITFLVGTKKDMLSEAAYREAEYNATKAAAEMKAEYWPTSSKSSENVQGFFFRLIGLAFDKMVAEEMSPSNQRAAVSIGNGLATVKKENIYDKRKKKFACNVV